MNTTLRRRSVVFFLVTLTLVTFLWNRSGARQTEVRAQSGSGWSEPVMVSTTTVKSWFPDIAVDNRGHAHVVWHSERDQEVLDLLMYTTWDGQAYSEPNDIFFPGVGGYTVRPVVAADDQGKLHLVYRQHTDIYYSQAPVDAAWSAASWTSHRRVSGAGTGTSYYSDVAVDGQRNIHVVWSESVTAGTHERWLWLGTLKGDALYDYKGWRTLEHETRLDDREIYAIIEDNAGVQWFGTDEGVYRFDGGTWTPFTTQDGLADQVVSSIAQDLDGKLWFGTGRGVSVYDETAERDDDKWRTYTVSDGLPDDVVHAIATDPLGVVWVGTAKGLARYDGLNWTSYTPQDGLMAAEVLAVAVDKQGDTWAGTRQGVSRYDGHRWMTYTTESGLLSNVVTALATDQEGTVWIGTDRGVSRFDGWDWAYYAVEDGLVDGAVTALTVDSEGTVWVGTETGVSRYDGRSWEVFELPPGISGQRITAIAEDQQVNSICPLCADIFYRHSTDGGESWSASFNLSNSFAGSGKPQIRVGSGDNVYVIWEEGEDWITHEGYPVASAYVHSPDGGNTWAEPIVFSHPRGAPQQITLGVGRDGNLVVVWRLPEEESFYYQISADNGATWSEPELIPGVVAKPWGPFSLDGYDAATDSAGNVHLLVLGRLASTEKDLSLCHLVWNGLEWSSATRIYASTDPPEWPKIDIGLGNQVYATWFTRDERHIDDSERGRYKVWVSSYQASAPPQIPAPLPVPTPTPSPDAVAEASPNLATMPALIITPGTSGLPSGLNTESDEIARLVLALSPVVVVLLVIVVVRFGRFGFRR